MEEQVLTFRFDHDQEERLDHFLVEKLPGYSRARLQALIRDGFVKVNGGPAGKAGFKLERGAAIEVRIPPTAPSGLIGENIPPMRW